MREWVLYSGLVTISRAQKTKMSSDAGMEKMYFRPRNRTTDVMANYAPTRQKLKGTGKSHPKNQDLVPSKTLRFG